jgi:predicted dehydrogenase
MLTDYKRDDSPHAVPMEIEGELQFANGITSTFYNSFVTGHQQWAHVSGTEGHLYIPDFVLPYVGGEAKFEKSKPEFTVNDCDFEMTQNLEQFSVQEPGNSAPNSQETNLFRNFANIVLSKALDPHWPSIALQTQKLMDAVFESATNDSRVIEIS